MASITDHVVEGLKYPLNDVKKVLIYGVLFAVLNLTYITRGIESLYIIKAFSRASGNSVWAKLSQIPQTDVFTMAFLSIIALIVLLLILGYQYNLIKFSIDKKEILPGFKDILGLFKNGIKYLIVTVAYNVIPTIVLIAGVLTVNESYGIYLMLLSMALFIIVFFFLIMAINNMVAYDKLSKAFDFREITDRIANLGWGKYIGIVLFTLIVLMVIMVALEFILGILTMIFTMAVNQAIYVSMFMGIIEGLFASSYCGVFYNRVLGSIYRESLK